MDTRYAVPLILWTVLYGEGHGCRRLEWGSSEAWGCPGSEGPSWDSGNCREDLVNYDFSFCPFWLNMPGIVMAFTQLYMEKNTGTRMMMH